MGGERRRRRRQDRQDACEPSHGTSPLLVFQGSAPSAQSSASTSACGTSPVVKACADAAGEDEVQRAVAHLLVAPHVGDQAGGGEAAVEHVRAARAGRRARGGRRRGWRRPGRNGRGGRRGGRRGRGRPRPPRHAAGRRRSRFGLQRVAEGVAEVEQGAAVIGLLLALVVADHGGLEGAGAQHGLRLGVAVAGEQRGGMGLAPGEEGGVADQAGLGDLGVAGAQFATARVASVPVSASTMRGWWKAPSRFLPWRGVDAGLAADAAVDLGEQRGRDLHEGQAAQRGGGGEAGEVADHAAAERDHRGAPLDAGVERAGRRARCSSRRSWRPRPAARRSCGGRCRFRSSPASRAGRCRAATVSSVTTTARFCGRTCASRAPARASRPAPTTTS